MSECGQWSPGGGRTFAQPFLTVLPSGSDGEAWAWAWSVWRPALGNVQVKAQQIVTVAAEIGAKDPSKIEALKSIAENAMTISLQAKALEQSRDIDWDPGWYASGAEIMGAAGDCEQACVLTTKINELAAKVGLGGVYKPGTKEQGPLIPGTGKVDMGKVAGAVGAAAGIALIIAVSMFVWKEARDK